MKNENAWKPTKFVHKKGRLVLTRDSLEAAAGSRLAGDIVASLYDTHLKVYARGKLADLGCGKVPLYASYKDYVTDNICVDWENTSQKSPYLDFECDLTKRLPFEDEEFDTVLLSDVLEHIPEPMALCREISRILREGGHLLMNVPFYYWLHEEPHDFYRYTEFALRRFADASGLEIKIIKPLGGAPEILADVTAKNLISFSKFATPLAIAVQSVTAAFLKTGFGKRVSEKTGVRFPLGYFLVACKQGGSDPVSKAGN